MARLLAKTQLHVRAQLQQIWSCQWERFLDGLSMQDNPQAEVVDAFVRAVVQYETQAAHVAGGVDEQIETLLEQLHTCDYVDETIRSVLGSLQRLVDSLAQHNYVNVDAFVRGLQERLDCILHRRVEDALASFTASLDSMHVDGDTPVVQVVLRAQTLQLEPALDMARAHWFDTFGTCLDTVLLPVSYTHLRAHETS